MKLIFIRHGQTNYNLKDLCNSRPDPRVKLTALGRQQVQVAAEKLKGESIDAIFTSALFRTHQTARVINKYHHAPTFRDPRLNDRSTGIFEGKPAGLFFEWWDKQKNPWTCSTRGGESYEDMKARFVAFLEDLKKRDYKTVLIVTHLPVLTVVYGYFKGLSNKQTARMTDKQIPNTKIMRFTLPKKK